MTNHASTSVAAVLVVATFQLLAALACPAQCTAPSIQSHPANAYCRVSDASFSVGALGTAPLSFQWQLETSPGTWIDANNGGLPYNGGTIIASGATTDHLQLTLNVIPGAPPIDFRCVVTNACGSATTYPATLSIFYVATITSQPANASTCPTGTASFSLAASGPDVFAYLWEVLDPVPPNGRWLSIGAGPQPLPSGGTVFATTPFNRPYLTLAIRNRTGVFRVHCIAQGICGSVITNSATLTIACISDQDDGSGTGTCDGGVTIDDLLYYLNIFEQGTLAADVDDGSNTGTPDGGVTIDDLLYYLQRFEAGC